MVFNNIKRLCAEFGKSIADIEKGAGIGKNVIYKWNKGMPSSKNLQAVAAYADVIIGIKPRKPLNTGFLPT